MSLLPGGVDRHGCYLGASQGILLGQLTLSSSSEAVGKTGGDDGDP
jgi:hypothetical protein